MAVLSKVVFGLSALSALDSSVLAAPVVAEQQVSPLCGRLSNHSHLANFSQVLGNPTLTLAARNNYKLTFDTEDDYDPKSVCAALSEQAATYSDYACDIMTEYDGDFMIDDFDCYTYLCGQDSVNFSSDTVRATLAARDLTYTYSTSVVTTITDVASSASSTATATDSFPIPDLSSFISSLLARPAPSQSTATVIMSPVVATAYVTTTKSFIIGPLTTPISTVTASVQSTTEVSISTITAAPTTIVMSPPEQTL